MRQCKNNKEQGKEVKIGIERKIDRLDDVEETKDKGRTKEK